MQTYYATHLPLPEVLGPSAAEAAVGLVHRWVAERFESSIQPWDRGRAQAPSAQLTWSTLTGSAGEIFGLSIDEPDATHPGWRWRSYVDVGAEDGGSWVRVRVHLSHDVDGVVTDPGITAGRPGVVRLLADELGLELDGRRLGVPTAIDADAVDDYVALLLDPQRRLPVIALSTAGSGRVFLDPDVVADRLTGLAHVVVLEDRASRAVGRRITTSLSCYQGAVRVYWPGFAVGDDPYHHRLYLGRALQFLRPEGLQKELFSLLGLLAGLAVGEPPLRRRLVQEAQDEAVERGVATRLAAAARIDERKQEDGSVSAEDFATFALDFDVMFEQLESHELDLRVAQEEIETIRAERDAARADLATALGATGGRDGAHTADEPPRTVLEAVRRAEVAHPHLIFLGEAFTSARESRYPDPGRVLEDLTVIGEIARDWAGGELPQGPHQAFKTRCSGYRDGIGDTASKKYAKDYERLWNGETIMLGPHVRRGTGPVATLMRIYFYLDKAGSRIVVGHIGRKLRDTTNSN